MSPTLASIIISFVILFIVFRVIELLRARERRLPVFRRGFATDLAYWAFAPVVTKALTRVALFAVIAPLALFVWGKIDEDLIRQGFGPVARLPLWVQAIAILLLADFAGYWMHRWLHGRRLWRFHAIHHSSVDLDWLSSVRAHPVDGIISGVLTAIPILGLGFAPMAVAGIVPVLGLMGVLAHANVDWDWGPLRKVIVSPRFHRWHHTDVSAGRDTNFAGLLPLWDILFGTYNMPRDQLPVSFGTKSPVPSGFIGQLAFPFRKQ